MEGRQAIQDRPVVVGVRMVVHDLSVRIVAELPGGHGILHPVVEAEERVERRGGAVDAPGGLLGREQARPPGSCPARSADRRPRPSPPARRSTSWSRIGWTSSGVDSTTSATPWTGANPLIAIARRQSSGVTLRPVAGRLDGSTTGASSPMGIPSSWAHASSVRASGTISVVPGIVPSNTSPELPSIVMTSPASQDPVADDDLAVADLDPGRADDGRDPPAAGHDRGVARQAAARRQDPGRPGHPVDVVGRGLGPDEDRRPSRLGRFLGSLGAGDDRAARHPR